MQILNSSLSAIIYYTAEVTYQVLGERRDLTYPEVPICKFKAQNHSFRHHCPKLQLQQQLAK